MERLNNKQTLFITEHIKDSSEVTHHVTSTLGFPLQRDLCLNFKKADKSLCSKKQNSLCVRTSEESFPRGSETRERGANSRLGGRLPKGRLGSFTREVETMSRSLSTFRRVWREGKKIYRRKVSWKVVDFVVAGSLRSMNDPTDPERSKLLIASIIHRRCLRLELKGLKYVERQQVLMNRNLANHCEVLYLLSASLAQRVLSALRPHTQSHHECFPSRFAVLFLLQEIFLLSVLFCLLAIRTNTQNIFW